MNKYKGIWCHVVWNGDEPEEFYISFGDYDYDNEPETDSFGVPDDQVFYYFDKQEQEELLQAIAEDAGTYQVDDAWYIDLTMSHELVEA